jgi:hypothetical protein
MTTYAKAVNGGKVEYFEQVELPPDIGPPPEWYAPHIERLLAAGFIEVVSGWPAPRPNATARPFITDGVVRWDDPRDLANIIAAAVAAVDKACEFARARILSQPTNTEEYHVAAPDAAKYRDAGFTGDVPESVASWAYAKRRQGWTAQVAAEDILATADLWTSALLGIRRLRLNAKELLRDATTNYEADLVLETFTDALAAAMQGVK